MSQTGELKTYFTKSDSLVIKGIAIVMMLIHHFWGFPEWIVIKEQIMPSPYISFIFQSLVFCVVIFSFISGYAYYFTKDKTYIKSLSRILKLLIIYGSVFILLMLIGIIFVHHHYTWASLNPYNEEERTVVFDWYIRIYIIFMLFIPLYSRFGPRNLIAEALITCILIPALLFFLTLKISSQGNIFASDIANLSVWTPCFFMGFLFGKYNLFEKLEVLLFKRVPSSILRYVTAILVFPVMLLLNYIFPQIVNRPYSIPLMPIANLIFAPLCIFSIVYISKNLHTVFIRRVFEELGRVSAFMWFLHGAFFNYEKNLLQPLLYFPRNPVVVTIWGILICYGSAFILNYLTSGLLKKISKTNKDYR